MADSTTTVDTISSSQASKEVTANGNFDAGSHAMTYGRRQSTSISLTWGYYGGRFGSVSVANGTVDLTPSKVNYIVAHRTTGVVSVSTAGTNWATPQTYARLYKVVCSAGAVTSYEDHRAGRRGVQDMAFGAAMPSDSVAIPITVGDVSTTITTGTGKAVIRVPSAMMLTSIRAALATESSSGAVTFDVNDGGLSVLSTKLTIDAGERTSTTAATPLVFNDGSQALADDAEITVDIDGAGTGAKGPTLWLIGVRDAGDPGRDFVVSDLSMEGANNGTTWTDAIAGRTWSYYVDAKTSTAQSLNSVSSAFAASSTLFNSSNACVYSTAMSEFDISSAPFAMSCWVRFTSLSNSPILMAVGSTATNKVSVEVGSSALRLYTINGSGAYRITGGALSTGVWYFVELTYDLTTWTLWLDGTSIGTSTSTVVPASASMNISLGNYQLGLSATYQLQGHMQRFQLTNGWHRRSGAYARPVKPSASI